MIGKVAICIRVIHAYLIEGFKIVLMGKHGLHSTIAKLGSIPERRFESDLARSACSPSPLENCESVTR